MTDSEFYWNGFKYSGYYILNKNFFDKVFLRYNYLHKNHEIIFERNFYKNWSL